MTCHLHTTFQFNILSLAVTSNLIFLFYLYNKTVNDPSVSPILPSTDENTGCDNLLNGKSALTSCSWHIYRKNETVDCLRKIEEKSSSSNDIWAEKVPPLIKILGDQQVSRDFLDDFREILDLPVGDDNEVAKYGFKISLSSDLDEDDDDAHWLNIILLPVSKDFENGILAKILENTEISYIFIHPKENKSSGVNDDFFKQTKQLKNVFSMTQNSQDIDELRTRFFRSEIPADRNVFLSDVSLTVNTIMNFECNRIIKPDRATCCMS